MAYIKTEWNLDTFARGDKEFLKGLNHMEEGIEQGGAGGELPAYPTDTSAEYVLALKYENGAWKKYWKETINKSAVVDSGMADYMVLKQ